MTTASAAIGEAPIVAGRATRVPAPGSPGAKSLVLLGPCVGYLLAFSLFPLLYSLGISFYEFDVIESDWTFVGLDNYRALWSDSVFWEAARTTALMVGVGVVVQSSSAPPWRCSSTSTCAAPPSCADPDRLPMLLNPVVVGLMWRALLNPDWGLVNWMLGGSAIDDPPNWLGDPAVAKWVLVFVDVWQWTPFVFIIVYARLQALPRRGLRGRRRWTAPTLGHGSPTSPCRCWRRRSSSPAIFRAIDAFRTFDLVYGLTYGGPGRTTTTLSFYGFETGFSFSRYGFSSAIAYVMVIVAAVASTVLFKRVDIRREDAR